MHVAVTVSRMPGERSFSMALLRRNVLHCAARTRFHEDVVTGRHAAWFLVLFTHARQPSELSKVSGNESPKSYYVESGSTDLPRLRPRGHDT
jgi:hypothetical protein